MFTIENDIEMPKIKITIPVESDLNKSGIYKIVNTVNGKCYIGSASKFKARWDVHKYFLNTNKHHSVHLQDSWNKNGECSFTFEIIEFCEKEKLIEREQFYIDLLKPEYNICKVAGSSLGRKHTEKSKNKMRISAKHRTPEHIAATKVAMLGKKHSEETKAEMSKKRKGRVFTEEHKLNLSLAHKGKDNGLTGHKHTEETKAIQSEAAKLRWAKYRAAKLELQNG